MRKLFVAALSIAALGGASVTARAQGMIVAPGGGEDNPQCVRFGDKAHDCTCALATGGRIQPDGSWRYSSKSRWTKCMRQKGWL